MSEKQAMEVLYDKKNVVTVNVDQPPSHLRNYKSSISLVIGILHILIGAFSLIYQLACYFTVGPFFSGLWTGAWTAFMFFIAGALGITASKQRRKSLIHAFLAFNILSILVCGAGIGICSFGAWFDCCYDGLYWAPSSLSYIFIGFFVLEIIVAFFGALLCCVSCCACGDYRNDTGS